MFNSKVNHFLPDSGWIDSHSHCESFLKSDAAHLGRDYGWWWYWSGCWKLFYVLLGPRQVHVTYSLEFSTALFISDFPLLSKHILQNELSHPYFWIFYNQHVALINWGMRLLIKKLSSNQPLIWSFWSPPFLPRETTLPFCGLLYPTHVSVSFPFLLL